jgi:hypothetical protein
VSELTRSPNYESGSQEFESLRARHFGIRYRRQSPPIFALDRTPMLRTPTATARPCLGFIGRTGQSHASWIACFAALIARTRDPPSRANHRRPPGSLDLSATVADCAKGTAIRSPARPTQTNISLSHSPFGAIPHRRQAEIEGQTAPDVPHEASRYSFEIPGAIVKLVSRTPICGAAPSSDLSPLMKRGGIQLVVVVP